MPFFSRLLASAAPLVLAAAAAHADVVISSDATQNMACSAGVCAPTSTDAVLNVGDLETLLASGNVTVTTTGSGVQANNIDLDAAFTSPDSTSLTLEAHNAITVDTAVSIGSGGAVLQLQSDTLNATDALSFGRKGHITFASRSDNFWINGGRFTLVNSIIGLAHAAQQQIRAIAFASGYDAGNDGTYSQSPVSGIDDSTVEGLGNTITNLSINDQGKNQSVGLFKYVGEYATIKDMRLKK
jgi:hypothetical protein